MQAWLHHCDWLKARTHDSIWANDSLPGTFSGKEMHSAKTFVTYKSVLFSLGNSPRMKATLKKADLIDKEPKRQ